MSASRRVTYARALGMLLPAVLAGAVLTACGSGGGLCGNISRADGLTVTRVNTLPQNYVRFTFPAKVTVRSPAKVRSVAQAACALPPMPSKPISCPADSGIFYRLTFTASGRKLTTVSADVSGCRMTRGLGRPRLAVNTFWHVLGVAMGLRHPNQSAFGGQQSP